MEDGYLKIGNKNIWYCVYGKEKKNTPILVIHGGPGFPSITKVISEFGEERPVYFYDQWGCGKSDAAKNPDDYSVESYVQELDDVRKALNLSEVILMGHSWGGGLVCSYMLERKPEGVAALILISPFLSAPHYYQDTKENLSRMPESVINAIKRCETENDCGDEYEGAMLEYYKKYLCVLRPVPQFVIELLSKINPEVYFTLWGRNEFSLTGKLKDFNLVPKLKEITVPVLNICGDSDEIGVKTMRDMQMAFPLAYLAVIPNASHLSYIEQPQIFKTVVNGFLKNI